MRYSYSRLNAFHTCKWMWKKQYTDKDDNTISNGFSDLGSLTHDTLEMFYKKEIEGSELYHYWRDKFEEMDLRFPNVNMIRAYRIGILSYLHQLGIKYPKFYTGRYKIVGVEREINIKLGSHDFIGFIDLELESPSGERIIVDHKISRVFEDKNLEDKLRQLYLYSLDYDRPPKSLMYNFFFKGKTLTIPFNKQAQDNALKWALDTIEAIEVEEEYKANPDKFFCNHICSYGHTCEFNGRTLQI